MEKEREIIKLTEEEFEDFDCTDGGGTWEFRDENYKFIKETRTDEFSDGASAEIVVKRLSDEKYFQWSWWESGHGYIMSDGNNSMSEVFPKTITTTTYE